MVLIDKYQPYVGPRPFEKKDKDLFFGREREARDLLSLVIAHQVVLVYAQSGAGKTSLLNTRLIPTLEENKGFQVLPIIRMQEPLPKDIELRDIQKNLHIFNTLRDLLGNETELNQFTELVSKSLSEFLQETKLEPRSRRAIIFDQFEELFTTYPERWQDREGFFQQISKAIQDDPLLRVVFVIREDYLAQLDPYAHILPDQFRIRFRLECLREKAALLAVKGPLNQTNCSFAEGVAESLVEELLRVRVEKSSGQYQEITGEFVEPVLLQVACQDLWQSLPPGTKLIKQEDLGKAFGDVVEMDSSESRNRSIVDRALSKFYEDSLTRAVEEADVEQGDLRVWFERELITQAETRGNVFRGPDETGMIIKIPNQAVESLEKLHLIRGESRAGGRWYELTHDRLIKPIEASNRKWAAELVKDVSDPAKIDKGKLSRIERWLEQLQDVGGSYKAQLQALEQSRLRLSSRVQTLAVQALLQPRHGENERGALLARQAYLLSQQIQAEDVSSDVILENVLCEVLNAPYFSHLLKGHEGEVSAVAFHPTSEEQILLVSGSYDGTIRLWQLPELGSPPIVSELYKHSSEVMAIAFNHDGKYLAFATKDGTVQVREFVNLCQLSSNSIFTGKHEGPVTSVAFSLDGKTLASSNRHKDENSPNAGETVTVKLWNIHNSENDPIVLTPFKDWVWSVAFHPEKLILAVGCRDGTVQLWDLEQPDNPPQILGEHQDEIRQDFEVFSVTFSPTGEQLAAASRDGTIRLWNVNLWNVNLLNEKPQAWRVHKGMVKCVAFSPNGQRLASGSRDQTVRLWEDLSQLDMPPIVLEGYHSGFSSIAFSSDSQILAAGCWDNSVQIWDLRSPSIVLDDNDKCYSVAFSPNRKLLASGNLGNTVRLWHLTEFGTVVGEPTDLQGHTEAVRSVCFRDDSTLISGSYDGTVRLWQIDPSNTNSTVLYDHKYRITSVVLSPDKQTLAIGSEKGVQLLTLNQQNTDLSACESFSLKDSEGKVWSVAFSLDGQYLAAGCDDGSVKVWDLRQPDVSPNVQHQHKQVVRAVAFSSQKDRQILASGSSDQTICLWNLYQNESTNIRGPVFGVGSVAFSPNSKRLATGGWDHNVQLRNPDDPFSIPLELHGHTSGVSSVAFSSDGQMLASGSHDKTVRIWIVGSKTLADQVCRKVWRNLTREEWQQFVGSSIPYECTCDNLPPDESAPSNAPTATS